MRSNKNCVLGSHAAINWEWRRNLATLSLLYAIVAGIATSHGNHLTAFASLLAKRVLAFERFGHRVFYFVNQYWHLLVYKIEVLAKVIPQELIGNMLD